MNDLFELLEHVDDATRSEVIKRCAGYEREIKRLNVALLDKDNRAKDKMRKIAYRDIVSACRRARGCTVFYDKDNQTMRILTQETRVNKARLTHQFVGIYDDKSTEFEIKSDIAAVI